MHVRIDCDEVIRIKRGAGNESEDELSRRDFEDFGPKKFVDMVKSRTGRVGIFSNASGG
jgi:hypothetical protein